MSPNVNVNLSRPSHRGLTSLALCEQCVVSFTTEFVVSARAVRRGLRFFILIRED